jgi:hypothetical protein
LKTSYVDMRTTQLLQSAMIQCRISVHNVRRVCSGTERNSFLLHSPDGPFIIRLYPRTHQAEIKRRIELLLALNGVCLDMEKNLSILSIVDKLLSTNKGTALPSVPDRCPVKAGLG